MSATRREFLIAGSVLCAPTPGLAFPIPIPATPPPKPLPRPTDDLPPLPDGAFRRLGSRRFRTGKPISRLQFSPSGKLLIGADREEIRGWEVANAKPVFAMPYPQKMTLTAGRVTSRDTIVVLGQHEDRREQHYEIHHFSFATGQ